MKRLTCELCGSNDFVKEDGLFVCQSCGTKYSPEEAKKMMIEGTVEVKGTVQVDNSSIVDNYLSLAEDALDKGELDQVHDYAQRVLDMNSNCTKAWIIKFKAYEKSRLFDELISTGKSILRFSDESEKNEIEEYVYSTYIQHATSITRGVIKSLHVNQAAKDRVFATKRDLNKAAGNIEIMQIWSKALVDIISTNLKSADSSLEWEQKAFNMVNEIPASVLATNNDIRKAVSEWISGRDEVLDAYDAKCKFYNSQLSGGPLTNFVGPAIKSKWDGQKQNITNRVKEAEQIAEKARLEHIAEYWKEHQEEKIALEKEKVSLKDKEKNTMGKIVDTEEYRFIKVIETEIKQTRKQLETIGVFKIKEKKVLREKLADLDFQLREAKTRFQKATAPLKYDLGKVTERINEIDKRLNLEL